jgi:hypothetical protein
MGLHFLFLPELLEGRSPFMDTNLSESLPKGTEDITPEDSACPVYRVSISKEQQTEMNRLNAESEKLRADEQAKELARQSALIKLSKLGLTEDEARAIVGA